MSDIKFVTTIKFVHIIDEEIGHIESSEETQEFDDLLDAILTIQNACHEKNYVNSSIELKIYDRLFPLWHSYHDEWCITQGLVLEKDNNKTTEVIDNQPYQDANTIDDNGNSEFTF